VIPTVDALVAVLRRHHLLVTAPAQDAAITALATDSRDAVPGTVFLALPGTVTDGHRFVGAAAERGAVAAVVEHVVDAAVPQVVVSSSHRAAIVLAREWHGDPAARLTLAGVTGTNGKTTTTMLLRHLLDEGGTAAVIGTLGAYDGAGRPVASSAGRLTTPGPLDLQATLARLVERGTTHVAMETSSHSLDQGRLDGLTFAVAVFTNLTRDHLDYHLTMEHYRAAKLRLLDLLAPGAPVVVNRDDRAWDVISRHPVLGFGRGPDAEVRAEGEVWRADGSSFLLAGRYGAREVTIPLAGEFNVSNALAAAAAALALGVPLDRVAARLGEAPQVPGRMERLATTPCTVLRDYSHTPDALARALGTLRPLTPGRLMVLFGCGGDRDRGKRPEMGRIAAEFADEIYLTTDNPRTEPADRIIADIEAGIPAGRYHRIPDREEAIAAALDAAREGDTLLLAGKGHETYQLVAGEVLPFDEKVIVRRLTGQEA
jgi:UDP-N-acetylmuramoyl-L-alanyl-D-glutamate--2,6-diaminopimelate ligase